jgi:hypothetical protein
MRIYKKGGKSDENPPKPAPAPDRLRSRGLPNQPQPELQMNTLGRLQQMMEAMQKSDVPRDFGPRATREDVIQYIANRYNMPVEDVAADMPEPVRAYIKPMAGGGGDIDQGYGGLYTRRAFSGEKRRNNPHGNKSISIAGKYADNALVRNEELIHSMQDKEAFMDPFTYEDLIDPVLKGMKEIDNIDMRDPVYAEDLAYGFDPMEMEAKVMSNKMALRNLGVIGEGELTEEDLDNMYLYANDMYRSDDPISSNVSQDLMRLFGSPQRKRFQDPEYRAALLNLFNKL